MKTGLFRALALTAAVAAIVSCTKHKTTHRGDYDDVNHNPNGETEKPTTEPKLEQMKAWTIGYSGREDFIETDGRISKVERIRVSGTGKTPYLVSLITVGDYDAIYDGDVMAFLKDQAKDAKEEFIYTTDPNDILFDRLKSGQWYGFIVGLSDKGEATGAYNYIQFNVNQESPTEAYSHWLGSWRISRDGVSYDVTITQDDANYTYRMDGWETGASIDKNTGTVMDQEWIYTWFEPSNGDMYFVSSFVGNYDDDNLGNVDEIFMGQVNYTGILGSKGLYIIDEEGLDIAHAEADASDASAATIYPCDVVAVFDWGNNGEEKFETKFSVMQYMCYSFDNERYYVYNENVPALPLTMTRIAGDEAPHTKASLQTRPRTKADVLHTQPRAHRSKTHTARALTPTTTSTRER